MREMNCDAATAYNDGYKTGYKTGYKDAMNQITNPVDDYLKRADEIVCREFELTSEELHKRTRERKIVEARQMAIYVRRKIFNLSLIQCGNDFGLDHSTAIWAVRQAETLIINDKLFKARAQRVLELVNRMKKISEPC